jgi:hypothetical protein
VAVAAIADRERVVSPGPFRTLRALGGVTTEAGLLSITDLARALEVGRPSRRAKV